MEIYPIGKSRQMFWNDRLLDLGRTTAFFRSASPQKRETCLILDQDEELYRACYFCIVKDDKGYKLYYVISNKYTAVAVMESTDGIHWQRPQIHDTGIPDSRCNSILAEGLEDGFYVFYDTNPACPPKEKYKAIGRATGTYKGKEGYRGLWSWVSADGYHFGNPRLLTDCGTFDSLNTVNFINGRYVCYFRGQHGKDKDGNYIECKNSNAIDEYHNSLGKPPVTRRDIRRIWSEDFVHWSYPEMIRFDDGEEVETYTNHIMPCPNAPELMIGFPVRYTSHPEWTQNEEQMNSSAVKKYAMVYRGDPRCGLATTDCLFMYSGDGLLWHRFEEAFITPGYEGEHNWVYGDCYPAYGLIEAGETVNYMYCVERNRSPGVEKPLVRYEIRKDGFGCRMTGGREAVAVTQPLTFEGSVLHLNFETSAAGYIYVDVLDAEGNPLSEKKSFEVYGNNIDRKVWFADDTDFGEFAGKPVRLRFTMQEAKLYSMWFE